MFFTMANFQRIVISVLVILTATFLFFAQSGEASKGPKITNKVCGSRLLINIFVALIDHYRSTSISIPVMSLLGES